jgi:hypothetical protein
MTNVLLVGDAIKSSHVELVPGRLRLFAVDRWTRWGAAFRFGLSTNAIWMTDTILAERTNDAWQDLSSGGARGSRWELPWKRPGHGHSVDILWKGDRPSRRL